jgi:Fuseless
MLKKFKIDKDIPNALKDSKRAKFFHYLAVKKPNLLIIYKAVSMIMVWCGIWGLLETFVFPDNPALRYVLVLVLGLFFLYLDDGSIDELTEAGPTHYTEHHPEALHHGSEFTEKDSEE